MVKDKPHIQWQHYERLRQFHPLIHPPIEKILYSAVVCRFKHREKFKISQNISYLMGSLPFVVLNINKCSNTVPVQKI
jgi:hypothetical protein